MIFNMFDIDNVNGSYEVQRSREAQDRQRLRLTLYEHVCIHDAYVHGAIPPELYRFFPTVLYVTSTSIYYHIS